MRLGIEPETGSAVDAVVSQSALVTEPEIAGAASPGPRLHSVGNMRRIAVPGNIGSIAVVAERMCTAVAGSFVETEHIHSDLDQHSVPHSHCHSHHLCCHLMTRPLTMTPLERVDRVHCIV